MSIEVIYQGLTIAKGPSFRLQDGGVFVELDGPMPVATALSLQSGEHALHGRVRRVSEGAGAGMLIVPTDSQKLPRWLVQLGPTSITNVELAPEPVVAAPPEPEPVVAAAVEPSAVSTAAEPAAEAQPAPTQSEAASAEASHEGAEPAAASGHTPSEHEGAAKDEEDEHAKPSDKKPSGSPPAAKKKKARKR